VADPSHVWVVIDGSAEPVAAFTIKHVCGRWLDDQADEVRDRYSVLKFVNCTADTEGPFWPEEIIDWWKRRAR
jgi:hypothetical protein